jgi:hypothetical protein
MPAAPLLLAQGGSARRLTSPECRRQVRSSQFQAPVRRVTLPNGGSAEVSRLVNEDADQQPRTAASFAAVSQES